MHAWRRLRPEAAGRPRLSRRDHPASGPPSFVYDLVPQGRGRGFLVDLLKVRDADRLVVPLLAAGTTGVQGVAPKLLLARNAEGRWFADLALDDALAREH